jgi:hypothetical protein
MQGELYDLLTHIYKHRDTPLTLHGRAFVKEDGHAHHRHLVFVHRFTPPTKLVLTSMKSALPAPKESVDPAIASPSSKECSITHFAMSSPAPPYACSSSATEASTGAASRQQGGIKEREPPRVGGRVRSSPCCACRVGTSGRVGASSGMSSVLWRGGRSADKTVDAMWGVPTALLKSE